MLKGIATWLEPEGFRLPKLKMRFYSQIIFHLNRTRNEIFLAINVEMLFVFILEMFCSEMPPVPNLDCQDSSDLFWHCPEPIWKSASKNSNYPQLSRKFSLHLKWTVSQMTAHLILAFWITICDKNGGNKGISTNISKYPS